MDMTMESEIINTSGVTWDCKVEDGIVPIILNDAEDLQGAILAGFLIKGTVPQLPNAGVPWIDYLTNKITFGTLDFYVRQSLLDADKELYYPQYDIQEDKLTMSIGKLTTTEE